MHSWRMSAGIEALAGPGSPPVKLKGDGREKEKEKENGHLFLLLWSTPGCPCKDSALVILQASFSVPSHCSH